MSGSGRICCIPAHSGTLQLPKRYLGTSSDERATVTTELQQVAATNIRDLATIAIGATGDMTELARERGVGAARRRAVLDVVARYASEPGFNPARAAALLGISVRYLHRLLEPTGRSFTDHLLSHRLQAAFDMLCNAQFVHLNIAAVAARAGFSDISHFNRNFRRAYGDTPYGVRFRATRQRTN